LNQFCARISLKNFQCCAQITALGMKTGPTSRPCPVGGVDQVLVVTFECQFVAEETMQKAKVATERVAFLKL